jgi:hypothetical protein
MLRARCGNVNRDLTAAEQTEKAETTETVESEKKISFGSSTPPHGVVFSILSAISILSDLSVLSGLLQLDPNPFSRLTSPAHFGGLLG